MRFGRISNLLTLSEINQATEQVYSLNPIWLNRSTCKPRVPFWTLGAVTYLEGCDDMKKYHKHKEAVNPLLRRKFTWLYDILCGTLENELGDPCVIDDMLGHPGFHIFGTKPGVTATPWQLEMMQEPLASVHLDIQYKEHGPYWKTYEEVDFANPLSFTMAIKLPKTGGGLFIWDWMNFEGDLVKDFNYQTEQEKWSYIDEQFADATKNHLRNNPHHWENDSVGSYKPEGDPLVELYREGGLIWFTGHILHQIMSGHDLTSDDARITLQGHGIKADGKWRIYF